MPEWKEHDMATLKSGVFHGTLKSGDSHPWKKNLYTTLAFSWADATNPGDKKVTVTVGDVVAPPYTVPQSSIAVDKKSGKLTNNTGKTINYTLS
jgi:hypothetical protein